jgi:rhamnulokinase
MSTVLAFDFGASGGRAVKAVFAAGGFHYEEVHRFNNVPIEKNGTLYWDFPALTAEVHTGIGKAGNFDSIGFDTWGVDFGLLDKSNRLIGLPVHYRDMRTNGISEKSAAVMAPERLYEETGNQIMDINTLFQLIALRKNNPGLFEKAGRLLFMPDLFAHSLGAGPVCEYTIASTSQMFNTAARTWSMPVLDAFGIPEQLFAPLVQSGTITGTYRNAKIIAIAGHDTQCAVAAMPCIAESAEHSVFLSCGTWSLLGTELDAPVLSAESMRAGLSNELGANGRVNYLKNIIGLWLIQESRREWKRKGSDYSFNDLEQFAREAKALQCFIDPDDPLFTRPGDIPGRIIDYCCTTGQYVPQTPGEIMRCIYESLVLKYRLAVTQLEKMTGKRFTEFHMLGGGVKDKTLCQFTADCCGIPVIAGPVEATALGNIVIQLSALGDIATIDEGRKLIAGTELLKTYIPAPSADWESGFERYISLISSQCKE